MSEAHGVLDPWRVEGLVMGVDSDVAMERPFDVAIQSSPPASPGMAHQSAVAGDRVVVEQALEILGLEFQILMPCLWQRILAVDGVEESHG
jgi:hypothetical protein